jgi:hypothetical protein
MEGSMYSYHRYGSHAEGTEPIHEPHGYIIKEYHPDDSCQWFHDRNVISFTGTVPKFEKSQ